MKDRLNKAINALKENLGDIEILSCFDNGASFLFAIKPKDMEVLDGYFLVTKKDNKIYEYSFLDDMNNFKKITTDPNRRIKI